MKNCTCYYFDDIVNIKILDLGNILLDEKTHGNNQIFDAEYKNSYGAKPVLFFIV